MCGHVELHNRDDEDCVTQVLPSTIFRLSTFARQPPQQYPFIKDSLQMIMKVQLVLPIAESLPSYTDPLPSSNSSIFSFFSTRLGVASI